MTVTMSAPLALDAGAWRLAWSSDLTGPTYYVYRDGRLVATTAARQMDFAVAEGECLAVEVLDDPDEMPASAFPGQLDLHWYSVAGTASYRIEEYVGTTWTLRAIVRDRGQGYFSWRSRWLEDVAVHQFRTVPVGTNGNQGTARTMTCLMVRIPDVPSVSYSYSGSTRKATISAA